MRSRRDSGRQRLAALGMLRPTREDRVLATLLFRRGTKRSSDDELRARAWRGPAPISPAARGIHTPAAAVLWYAVTSNFWETSLVKSRDLVSQLSSALAEMPVSPDDVAHNTSRLCTQHAANDRIQAMYLSADRKDDSLNDVQHLFVLCCPNSRTGSETRELFCSFRYNTI